MVTTKLGITVTSYFCLILWELKCLCSPTKYFLLAKNPIGKYGLLRLFLHFCHVVILLQYYLGFGVSLPEERFSTRK